MPIIDKLERQENLTEAERELALFVLANMNEVTHMSIAELADQSFTSNATVIRLCRKLGLKGYRDFRIELTQDVERRRNDVRSVDVNSPFRSDDELDNIMRSLASLQSEAIETCYSSVSRLEVRRAALAIRRAGRVFVFGQGDSRISAMAFANQLLKLGISCVDADRFDESLAQAITSKPGDVVLLVSYSGNLVGHLARALEVFRAHRCRIVLVSTCEKPVGVDVHLRFPDRERADGNIATFYSQECLRFLLNCVYAELFSFDYEANSARKAEVDALTSRG